MMKIQRKYFTIRKLIYSYVPDIFSLLKSYIHEWSKFYEQCEYLPKPFVKIETTVNGNPNLNSASNLDKTTRNIDQVRQLMLESWNDNIFKDIKHRLQV
jgi:cullin-5